LRLVRSPENRSWRNQTSNNNAWPEVVNCVIFHRVIDFRFCWFLWPRLKFYCTLLSHFERLFWFAAAICFNHTPSQHFWTVPGCFKTIIQFPSMRMNPKTTSQNKRKSHRDDTVNKFYSLNEEYSEVTLLKEW
jgi:hypothetical protein